MNYYSGAGISRKDEYFANDKNLEGYEGYSGNGMPFNLKYLKIIEYYLHEGLGNNFISY